MFYPHLPLKQFLTLFLLSKIEIQHMKKFGHVWKIVEWDVNQHKQNLDAPFSLRKISLFHE